MQGFRLPASLALCLLLTACIAGIPATDTSAVASGVSQAGIEAVFGEPDEVRKTGFGTVALYRYDRGLESVWERIGADAPPLPLKQIVVLGIESLRQAEEQKAFMAIAYAANGISIAYESDPDRDAAAARAAAAADRHVAQGRVKALGTAELLALARCGDPSAQDRIGWSYLNGFGVPRDPLEAYFWYRLAVQNAAHPGYLAHAKTDLKLVAAAMRPEEIRAVDARLETWQRETRPCGSLASNQPWK